MTLHFMSDKELSRLEILRDLGSGRLTTSAAAELLGLERRQVQRLVKAYQEQGATALISKKRGRPSNRQSPAGLKDQALELIRAKYRYLGATATRQRLGYTPDSGGESPSPKPVSDHGPAASIRPDARPDRP